MGSVVLGRDALMPATTDREPDATPTPLILGCVSEKREHPAPAGLLEEFTRVLKEVRTLAGTDDDG